MTPVGSSSCLSSIGRPLLTLVDEYTRECLAIDVVSRLTSEDVLERLAWLFVTRGAPERIRSDNGSEFTATVVRSWLRKLGVSALRIEPGSPWENGYLEVFNGNLCDELRNGEIFYTLTNARVLIEVWRREYNTAGRTARFGIARQLVRRMRVMSAIIKKPATEDHSQPAKKTFIRAVVSCSKPPQTGREGALAQETMWRVVVHSFRSLMAGFQVIGDT